MTARRRAEIWLSAIVCAASVVCGQISGNAYPFSSFAMYARVAPSASRILARDAHGAVAEVRAYAGWKCSTFTLADCAAMADSTIDYRDREALRIIRSPSAGTHRREPVLLIRRIYHFTPSVESHDCVMAHCTAERR